jgi:UDP-N-acetylglucosamine pyrophosphorylase
VCIHFFTRDFLERVIAEHEPDLIHHVAKKKIPYVDTATGKQVKPDKVNGIKMEKFVFDVFRFADSDKFAVWECVREDEFAPLKNAEGAADFTPTHCRNALYALHQVPILSISFSAENFFFLKEIARGGERTRVLSISFIFSFSPLYILLSHSGYPKISFFRSCSKHIFSRKHTQ